MGIKQDTPIRLYLTEIEDCSYLEGQNQRMLIVDPLQKINLSIGTQLSQKGFRRSGNMIYRPNCPTCNQCVSVRIPAERFTPSKSQKRVAKKNADLTPTLVSINNADNYFDMYLRYQKARHPDGLMCNPSIEMYKSFIESDAASSYLLVLFSESLNKPVSVSVVDVFADGISGVYTFFEPDFSDQSLGTNAVLEMVNIAKKQQLEYVYLGFWVEECSKMNYKTKFQPLEGYFNQKWQPIDKE